jgi:hypothetical protein
MIFAFNHFRFGTEQNKEADISSEIFFAISINSGKERI